MIEGNLSRANETQSPEPSEKNVLAVPAADGQNLIKSRDFFLGFAISFLGSIIFSLLALLIIAKINPAYETITTFLIFGWPVIFLVVYLFSLIHFFKKNRSVFWSVLLGLFFFLTLSIVIVIFI
jgi:hypothetical protein